MSVEKRFSAAYCVVKGRIYAFGITTVPPIVPCASPCYPAWHFQWPPFQEKTTVFLKYREIIFGILIGLAVSIMDTFMDAANEGLSFAHELTRHPSMEFYRLLFVVFGFILGWLLWQRNRSERDFRLLQESLEQLRHECGKRSLLLHASLQILLVRTDFHLPPEAEQLVRRAYESSEEIQTLVR